MIYSVYKGNDEIAFGTIEEIAKKLKVKKESVLFYGTPTYINRTSENARRLVNID